MKPLRLAQLKIDGWESWSKPWSADLDEACAKLGGSGEQKLTCWKSGTAACDSMVCLGRCMADQSGELAQTSCGFL